MTKTAYRGQRKEFFLERARIVECSKKNREKKKKIRDLAPILKLEENSKNRETNLRQNTTDTLCVFVKNKTSDYEVKQ